MLGLDKLAQSVEHETLLLTSGSRVRDPHQAVHFILYFKYYK